jgi:hypothetical protein
MVISYQSNDTVSIKTKQESILVGGGITIGSYTIPGAGEYDIASIQCEGQFIEKSIVYFLRAEDLTITFVDDADTSVTKVDDASNTDILILDLRSDSESDKVKTIIKGIEPSYVLLIGAGATPEFTAGLGLNPFESSTLKIVRSGLPMEGTFLVPRGF